MDVRRCVCPGSYDPVTNGHLDVFARAATQYDEVVVAVLVNPAKQGTFTAEERIALIEEAVATLPEEAAGRVRVRAFGGGRLLVDVARELGAQCILKGLRSDTDYAFELPMALMNRHLTGVETVFLPADPAYVHVSSSLVREVVAHGGDVSGLVPEPVRRALEQRLRATGRDAVPGS